MDLNHLEVFVKVYEERNFSKAATALYLTQPTISSHIASLEKELLTNLFERTTKQVIPTPKADLLYKYSLDILNKREVILKEFQTASLNDSRLLIGASTIPGNYILPNLISGFGRQNPNVKVKLVVKSSLEIMTLIKNKKINLGFIGKKLDEPGINILPFYNDSIVFIAPNTEHYKKIIRGKHPIDNLLTSPIILREIHKIKDGLKQGDEFLLQLGYDDSKLNIVDRLDDQDLIYEAVKNQKGISLISKTVAMEYKKYDKILVYNPVSFPMRRHFYKITRLNYELNSDEKKLSEFIRQNK